MTDRHNSDAAHLNGDTPSLRSDLLLALFLVALAVAVRLLPHVSNFSPVAAAALFAGFMLGRRWLALAVPVSVSIVAHPARLDRRGHRMDLRKRDLDNLVKPVLDVLKQHGALADDRWVDRIEVRRAPVCDGGVIRVTVAPYQEGVAA